MTVLPLPVGADMGKVLVSKRSLVDKDLSPHMIPRDFHRSRKPVAEVGHLSLALVSFGC